MLVLAGATAAEMGLDTVAAFCREKVLQHNTGHLVGHYPTIEAALADDDFQVYLTHLRRRYSRERAEHILGSLGISQANERDSYYTDYEYAAALMGQTPEELDRRFSQPERAIAAGVVADEPSHDAPPAEASQLEADSGWSPPAEQSARTSRQTWTIVGTLLVAVALVVVAVMWFTSSH